jgi:hypothetical protein
MTITRRDFLGGLGSAALGATIAGLGATQAFGAKKAAQGAPKLPFPYKKLALQAVANAGYEDYMKGACCYGGFSGVIDQLSKIVGSPYTLIPTELWMVGEGGMAGTGNICGAINGASFAIFLVIGGMGNENKEKAFNVIRDLYHWYEQTQIPVYKPQKAKKYEGDIVKSISGSTLCHVSVSNWCKASGFKAFSKERSERCGRLTADVVMHTAQLLNNYFDGSFQRTAKLSAAAESCRGCHDKGSKLENTRGMQECGQCHFHLGTEHPKTK